MRYVVFGFLVACSSDPERVYPQEPPPDAGVQRPAPPEEPRDAPAYDPCGRSERIVLPFDGGTIVFNVPLPCDPLWYLKDHGDPMP